MVPHAQLEIHIPNVLHNYRYFRSKLRPETKLLILIKANAYGHGAVPFAKAMEDAGADYIITVLSGDFVQRGLPAVTDKHTRARLALEAGSDLVLELPVPYALSSGEGFGFGGISLLHGLGCVDTVSFGTESGNGL